MSGKIKVTEIKQYEIRRGDTFASYDSRRSATPISVRENGSYSSNSFEIKENQIDDLIYVLQFLKEKIGGDKK